MKKISIIFCLLCPFSVAFGADVWNEQYTWSYDALANTLMDMQETCASVNTDVLLKLNDFVNEHDAKLSVKQLVDQCIDITNQNSGSTSCGISGQINVDNYSQTLSNQKNEFCDVFVSDFIDNHNRVVNKSKTTSSYWGCTDSSGIMRKKIDCANNFRTRPTEEARCEKCIDIAGTYENGRCYIEVVGWHCKGHGWNPDAAKNPASCGNDSRYQGCYIVRKYADAEKPFTCDVSSVISHDVVLSGCAQHGWSSGDKHPVFNLDGEKYKQMNCSLPLSNNTDWRVTYTRQGGSSIGLTYNGSTKATSNWCMPSVTSIPWNKSNHTGGATHLKASKVVGGGETIDYWYKF